MCRHVFSICKQASDQSKHRWRTAVGSRIVDQVSEGLSRGDLQKKLQAKQPVERPEPEDQTVLGPLPQEGEDPMADEMTYHNGYHYVRDNDDDHDEVLLGQHIASVGSAQRDVSDAGRDLTAASADANRDLISAGDDATRDLINSHNNGSQHATLLAAVLEGRGQLGDRIGQVQTDVARESGAVREEVAQQGKENIVGILDQGARGRETTLRETQEVRNDIADAHSQNLLAHCETQKLVIKEHCETREAVREEGVRTREAVREEARAVLERELRVVQESNSLLQLRLDILSGGGPGPLRA